MFAPRRARRTRRRGEADVGAVVPQSARYDAEAMAIARRFIRWLSSFVDAEGLDTTEYFGHVERAFGVRIGDESAGTLATLGDLCGYVARERGRQGRPLSDEAIWDTVRRVTSEEFGVDASELHPGIRYVEDLNC